MAVKCGCCGRQALRLQGFVGRREQWQCGNCGESSLLLDCELCERRLVRRLREPGHWACEQCAQVKVVCPQCRKRWLDENENCSTCGSR